MLSWESKVPFASVWSGTVARYGNRPFLIFEAPDGSVREWTYSEFDSEVSRAASLLTSLGVVPGRAVHLALTNSPAFVALWIAINRLGAWMVPSDPMSKTPELIDHIGRTKSVVGFCAAVRSKAYRTAAGIMSVIEIDETSTNLNFFPDNHFVDWPEVNALDRAAVMFTSGTTGRPKGVEVTQANYAFAGKIMAEAVDLQVTDRQLVVLPLFHANAQYYSLASAIWVGASVALMCRFSASRFLEQVVQYGATCASLFAAPLRMILAKGHPVDGIRLRHCWYAQNISQDQYDTLTAWFGCRPRQLYGMTETMAAVLTDEVKQPLVHSMGYITRGCSVDVQDDKGRSVSTDEIGEVVVGGTPGVTLFAGYLDDKSTTESSFRNGWFRTGDQAIRSDSGRHFFHGRGSDILKVAGENVSTAEIEAALSAHPLVFEAAVVGISDDIRDEVPFAFVVPIDSTKPPSLKDLYQWCDDQLAKVKCPKNIVLIDTLPRTSVGKIRKFVLAAEAQNQTQGQKK